MWGEGEHGCLRGGMTQVERAPCGIACVDRVLLATDHLTRGESERLDIDVRLGICVPLGICVECAEHGSQHWVLVQVCTDVV